MTFFRHVSSLRQGEKELTMVLDLFIDDTCRGAASQ
jgi:hypothetical protein